MHRPHRAHPLRALLALLAALAALCCLLGGCASAAPDANPAELLRRATLQFHSDLRWQRFDSAAALLPADQRADFLRFYESRRQSLFVTEFEVIHLQLSTDQKSAFAQVLMSWYELPSTQVRTSMIEERWAFHEALNRWEVVEQQVELVPGPLKTSQLTPPP
jgi:hypothetical protein